MSESSENLQANRKEIGVAIVGCGTVGGATASILLNQQNRLSKCIDVPILLRAIVDVDFTHARELGLDESLFTENLDAVLSRDDVQIVAELIGGTDKAKEVVERALRAGKNVVTANKALLAHHGFELVKLARENSVCISFEASCAGAIPIISVLTEQLACDRIDAMYGIVNGTCNYILTAMSQQNRTYSEALAIAQQHGMAEADPSLDVMGHDSAHKLAILAALAFGQRIDLEKIYVEGINNLHPQDIQYGKELGYVIKLLAVAKRQGDALSLRVHPAFISTLHPLAWVSGPFNAVSIYAENAGHLMFYGRGAGVPATAAAVVGDIASIALGNAQRKFDKLRLWPDRNEPAKQLDIGTVRCRYYIRLQVEDRPGVFAQVARILGDRQISISSLLQHESAPGRTDGVPVVITTYDALEANVQAALAEINQLEVTKAPCVCIRMVAEHPEKINS